MGINRELDCTSHRCDAQRLCDTTRFGEIWLHEANVAILDQGLKIVTGKVVFSSRKRHAAKLSGLGIGPSVLGWKWLFKPGHIGLFKCGHHAANIIQ